MSKQAALSPETNIVHESEVQRQYVRVNLPCRCKIAGHDKNHKIRDISSGGFQIETDRGYKTDDKVEATILFPLKNSAFHIKLPAKQIYFDKEKGIAGFQFTDLTGREISLIRNLVKNYLAGVLTTENDIIDAVSRNNYSTPRAMSENDNRPRWRRYVPMALIVLGALTGLTLIAGNIYENTAIVKSYSGSVSADSFTLRSEANGKFYSLLSQNTQIVSEGQPIAVIRTRAAQGSAPVRPEVGDGEAAVSEAMIGGPGEFVLKSPCDCMITQKFAQDGEFRAIGEPVYDLLSKDEPVSIVAAVRPEDIHRLQIYDDVNIKVAGESAFIQGSISSFLPPQEGQELSQVRIAPDADIPAELVGRPAYVEFMVN